MSDIFYTTEMNDPFDEPLEINDEEKLVINDTYLAAARDAITIDGMEYSFLKPPYMNFDDHLNTKKKLKEAFTQCEYLMLTPISSAKMVSHVQI